MKKSILLFAFIIINIINAQESPFIEIKDSNRRIDVTTLNVNTVIHGSTAETTMFMTFYNDSNKTLEGVLNFPLPEKALVTSFSLDVEGIMTRGVIVKKKKAREVYETIVRRGVDPGLLEQTAGNYYKTRIYPLMPESSRSIEITWQSNLDRKNGAGIYSLPLRYTEPLLDFTLKIEVVKAEKEPVIIQEGHRFSSFTNWNDSYTMEYKSINTVLDETLSLRIPDVNKKTVTMEQYTDGQFYFTIDTEVESIKMFGTEKTPAHMTLYWDASASRTENDIYLSRKTLNLILEKYRRKTVLLDVIVFRDKAEKKEQFILHRGASIELKAFFDNLAYDGGTQTGNLPEPDRRTDLCLLFSDGLSTFGSTKLTDFNKPLFTFSASEGSDAARLRYMAERNGGEYFNLLTVTPEKAAKAAGRPGFRYQGYNLIKGELAETYPEKGAAAGGIFRLSGIMASAESDIELLFGTSGTVEKKIPVSLKADSSIKGQRTALNFAAEKLAMLMVFQKSRQKEIEALGKKYQIVTPGTSLLVLESPKQYIEFDVEPPYIRPEWRREYFAAKKKVKQAEEIKRENKLNSVLSNWQAKVNWWQKDFEYPSDLRIMEESKKIAESAERMMESEAPSEMMISRSENDTLEEQSMAPAAKKSDMDSEPDGPSIQIAGWNPDTPYLKVLKNTEPEKLYKAYLKEKITFGKAPSFYLDCGDWFIKQNRKDLGIRIWSNLAEMGLEEPGLLRILAHRLAQEKEWKLSEYLFRKVKELRPEEPQSWRDLALVLADLKEYPEAIELLWQVISGSWIRFEDIELIALMELNRIIALTDRKGIRRPYIDKRFIRNLDTDIRIMLTWDADMTDMDLWVTEPSGEKASYANTLTRIGGHFSRDFTQGYGPEEYLLKKAMKGPYKIEVNYYSSGAPTLSGTVTMQVDVFTNYGRTEEEKQSLTVRLSESTEVQYIGTIEY